MTTIETRRYRAFGGPLDDLWFTGDPTLRYGADDDECRGVYTLHKWGFHDRRRCTELDIPPGLRSCAPGVTPCATVVHAWVRPDDHSTRQSITAALYLLAWLSTVPALWGTP